MTFCLATTMRYAALSAHARYLLAQIQQAFDAASTAPGAPALFIATVLDREHSVWTRARPHPVVRPFLTYMPSQGSRRSSGHVSLRGRRSRYSASVRCTRWRRSFCLNRRSATSMPCCTSTRPLRVVQCRTSPLPYVLFVAPAAHNSLEGGQDCALSARCVWALAATCAL